jgi:hypothetical protein
MRCAGCLLRVLVVSKLTKMPGHNECRRQVGKGYPLINILGVRPLLGRTVEHPFGNDQSPHGATQFLMKTLPRVAAEMALHVLANNMTRVSSRSSASAA